jgi:hypothetical protein
MMKLILSTGALWVTFYAALNAQSVINTTGGSFSTPETVMFFSIGEPVTITSSGTSAILTQGFLQPEAGGWVEIITIADQNWEVKVFPNPATDFVTIQLVQSVSEDVNLRLYSTDGKLVLTDQIPKGNYNAELSLRHLAAGWYCLHLTTVNGDIIGTLGIACER